MHIVRSTKPYWVVAPPYTHASSGVRVLYKLMDSLIERGHELKLTPDSIVIYPDVTKGNPLRAKNVVRYLLAPAGKYGGSVTFPRTDMVWGYSKSLAENVMFVPVSDPDIFYPPYPTCRVGACFYSHKFEMHGNAVVYEPMLKRLNGTLQDISETLRTSTRCFVYELSSVIHEAALCGCPVTLMRTPYFNEYNESVSVLVGDIEWSDGQKVCSMTAEESHRVYARLEEEYKTQLDAFINSTQERFS